MSDQEESTDEQLARNMSELLQELRVVQTGVQILTGFLLTVPFSSRFGDLTPTQERVFLAVLCGAVLTTCLVVSPVAFHRALFRQRERRWIITASNRSAKLGLTALAITTSGVVWLVFDVVTGRLSASIAGGLALAVFLALWAGVPLLRRS